MITEMRVAFNVAFAVNDFPAKNAVHVNRPPAARGGEGRRGGGEAAARRRRGGGDGAASWTHGLNLVRSTNRHTWGAS